MFRLINRHSVSEQIGSFFLSKMFRLRFENTFFHDVWVQMN